MHEPQTWRELLDQYSKTPTERRKIARTVGVSTNTLQRWVSGESTPRRQNLLRLPTALPHERSRLLEFLEQGEGLVIPPEKLAADSEQVDELSIPAEFYKRMLYEKVHTSNQKPFWSLGTLIVQQMISQLDPQGQGIAVSVARCMPSSCGKQVHSLCEIIGQGTPPWTYHLERRAVLLGAESLVGYAVSVGHLQVNHDLQDPTSMIAGYADDWERSAVAAPIMLDAKVAGCLLVSSTRPYAFEPAQLTLIERYADVFTLAFEPHEFLRVGTNPAWFSASCCCPTLISCLLSATGKSVDTQRGGKSPAAQSAGRRTLCMETV